MRARTVVSFSVAILLTAVLFAGVTTVPAAAAQSDTMQFRYNAARTGDYSPVAGSTPSNGNLKWSYTTGGSVSSSPAVVSGTVYVGSWDGNIYALNAATGKLKWSYTTGGWVNSSPAVVNGVVYVGDYDGVVYALNAQTGAKIWSYTTRSPVYSSPAVANGVVYVGSNDYNIYALNAFSGHKLWNFTTGGWVDSSPAVANGVVYVGSLDNKVYALEATTGTKLWNFTTGGGVWSSPAISNGVVYVGSRDYTVYALNAFSGHKLWNFTTGNIIISSAAISNGVAFVASLDGNVYAIGNQKTTTTLTLIPSTTTPSVAQSVTFTATLKSSTAPLSGKSITVYHYLNGVKYTDTIKTTNAVGQITLVQRFGSAGKRTYYAAFAGDNQYAKSQVGPVTVTVRKVPTTATLTVSKTSPAVNQQVTFTAKLCRWNPTTNSDVPLAGKPVTIWHTLKGVRYNDVLKTTDAYGKITFVQKFGSVGVRYYYATFVGDSTYAAKTTSVLTIAVH